MRNGGASFRGLSLTLSIEWQRAQLTRAKLRPLCALVGDRAANIRQVLDTRMELIIKTRIEETFVVQARRSRMLASVIGGPGGSQNEIRCSQSWMAQQQNFEVGLGVTVHVASDDGVCADNRIVQLPGMM
jgi:hypothetical protein